ncbi:MAG: hypothetical protein J1F33_02880 [Clostridiales bacterium]|nr:hypothetical protein [Clostridiales bacterium]
MKKRLLFIVIALIAALSSVLFFACAEKADEGVKYTISVEKEGEGTVKVASSAKAGSEVTVTMSPSDGYHVGSVKVNSKAIEFEANSAKFTMPEEDVTLAVVFAENTYALEIAEVVGGTVTADRDSYKSGDTVTLTVTPGYGYELASLKVDGSSVTVTNNKYTFTMPGKAVPVEASFDCSVDTKALPSGSMLTLTAAAPITAGVAKAELFVTLGDDAVTVTAYVEDGSPIVSSDGLRLYFGTNEWANNAVSDKNFYVSATLDGTPEAYVGDDGDYLPKAQVTGVTVTSEAWSKGENKVSGYIITVSVDYDNLAVTSDTSANLTVLPYLVNADRRGSLAAVATVDSYYDYANPDTYMTISDSKLVNNRYMFGKGVAGSYKNVVSQGAHWDTSRDYEEGSSNYNNRQLRLTGNDNSDNNIAFFASAGTTSFVKATFQVTAVYNDGDKYPKFGLMAFDASARDTGVFFYVDAEMTDNKTSGFGVSDITGTKLGYATKRGAWTGDYKSIESTNGAYNRTLRTVTMAMLYKDGAVYMYRYTTNLLGAINGTVLVAAAPLRTDGEVVIGIKSFGIGLTVSSYDVTNDENSSFISGLPQRTNGETIGDSRSGFMYTDGWAIDGDTATNTGSANQYIFVRDALYNTDVYGEVNITSPEKIDGTSEEWTKVGMVLKNDKYSLFGYIDLADQTNHSEYGRAFFAVYNETSKSWTDWAKGRSVYKSDVIKSSYINLAIAKVGQEMYLIVNGEIAVTYSDPKYKDDEFVAGAMSFNRKATVKDGVGLSGAAAVREKLGIELPSDVEFDGVLDDDIWTTAVMNNKLTIEGKKGTKLEVVAVLGDSGVYVGVTMHAKSPSGRYTPSLIYNTVTHAAFRLSHSGTDAQYIAFYNGFDGDVTASVNALGAAAKSVRGTVDGVEGYITTTEFFIPLKAFGDGADTADKLPFYVRSFMIDDQTTMPTVYSGKKAYVTANGLTMENA